MKIGETNEWYGKGTCEALGGKEVPYQAAMLMQKYQFSIKESIFVAHKSFGVIHDLQACQFRKRYGSALMNIQLLARKCK